MKNVSKALLFCLLGIAFFPAFAQVEPSNQANSDSMKVYISVDVYPEFPGGEESLSLFIQNQLKGIDLKDKPAGLVILRFIVTTNGEIENISVLKSLDPTLDQAAIELVKKMPRWTPGSFKGEIVNTRFALPIPFIKENQQKTKIKNKRKQ